MMRVWQTVFSVTLAFAFLLIAHNDAQALGTPYEYVHVGWGFDTDPSEPSESTPSAYGSVMFKYRAGDELHTYLSNRGQMSPIAVMHLEVPSDACPNLKSLTFYGPGGSILGQSVATQYLSACKVMVVVPTQPTTLFGYPNPSGVSSIWFAPVDHVLIGRYTDGSVKSMIFKFRGLIPPHA